MPEQDPVDALFQKIFDVPRDPRSPEYKQGVRAALAFRIHGTRIVHPFQCGTAASDAFFSGLDEGHHRWREHVASSPKA